MPSPGSTAARPARPEAAPTTAPAADAASGLDRRGRFRSVAAACAGNLVEWFDFFVYAYTSVYFSRAFFPPGDHLGQMLGTAGVFAVGFLVRPVGGWLFGRLADRHGRKHSMLISVFMMCLGALMIASLPTYSTIGLAAPALLLVARLVQGLSVGGEFATGATYLSEIAVPKRRGVYASFQYATVTAGQLLALLLLILLQAVLPRAALEEWGWRIPFLVGALAGLVVAGMRAGMHETATGETLRRKGAGSLATLLRYRRSLVLGFALTAGGSLYFYIFTTYAQKLLLGPEHLSLETVSVVMASALFLFMIAQPAFGALSDRIGKKANVMLFTGLGALTVVPVLTTLSVPQSPVTAFALIAGALAVASFYTSIGGILKADLFPAEIRALGVGMTHSFGNAIFGGTAEYLALLARIKGVESWFFYYAAVVLAFSFVAAAAMPDLRRRGFLDGAGDLGA